MNPYKGPLAAVRVLAVEPWQPACAHAQSMSGVLSMASHCGLQYLLLLDGAIVQVQIGCAHFSAFSVAIVFSRRGSKAKRSKLKCYSARTNMSVLKNTRLNCVR